MADYAAVEAAEVRHTMPYVLLFNPDGPDQDHVPTLMRRIADLLEQLGDVDIYNLVLRPPLDPEDVDDKRSITVYYDDKVIDADDDDALPGTGA